MRVIGVDGRAITDLPPLAQRCPDIWRTDSISQEVRGPGFKINNNERRRSRCCCALEATPSKLSFGSSIYE